MRILNERKLKIVPFVLALLLFTNNGGPNFYVPGQYHIFLKILDFFSGPKLLTFGQARLHKISSQRVLNQLNRPRIVRPIKDLTVVQGQNAKLECIIEGISANPGTASHIPYRVAWFKVDSQTILSFHDRLVTRDPRFNVTVDEGLKVWRLHINAVEEKDRGHYMCQINTIPMTRSIGYIDVFVPPRIIDSKTSRDITVNELSTVNLSCLASGHPTPQISWVIVNGIQPESDSLYYYFKKVKEPETGTNMTTYKDDTLPNAIVGKYVIKTPENRPFNQQHKLKQNSSNSILLNKSKKLHSQAGYSTDTGIYKNHSPEDQVFNILGQDKFLLLKNVTRNHMGTYICLAENGIQPSVSRQIELYVRFTPVILKAYSSSHIKVNVTEYGEPVNVSLRCVSQSFPQPSYIRWSQNNVYISNPSISNMVIKYKQMNATTTVSILSLLNVNSSNAGSYRCEINNTIGYASHIMTLKVLFSRMPLLVDTEQSNTSNKYKETNLEYENKITSKSAIFSETSNIHKTRLTLLPQLNKSPSAMTSGSTSSSPVLTLKTICCLIVLLLLNY